MHENSANEPKQHHYVPAWYLRGFIDKATGFLCIRDKSTNRAWKSKPEKALRQKQYYRQDWAPEGVDPNALEKALGEMLEPRARIALEKLKNDPTSMSAEDTSALLIYLDIQRFRVPRQFDQIRTLSWPISRVEVGAESLDEIRLPYMRFMLGRLARYLEIMEWNIIRAPSDSFFITSDSPLSLFNRRFPPPLEAGIALLGTTVHFPIDSSTYMYARHKNYFQDSDPMIKVELPDDEVLGVTVKLWPGTCVEDFVRSENRRTSLLARRFIVGATPNTVNAAMKSIAESSNT